MQKAETQKNVKLFFKLSKINTFEALKPSHLTNTYLMPKFCGTEVLKPKDIAFIRNITIDLARKWFKNAKERLGYSPEQDFTVTDYARVSGIELPELLIMLNNKFSVSSETAS
jgi:hypothetical protein